jgi:ketosteroid isomerase-like protein
MSDLEARIARLEAESEIRRLKARYLNSCDAKDVDAIRACFTPDAEIDFPPLGRFDVDGMIGIFTQIAATTPIVDVHQAHNAEIEVDGDEARARWNLGFATYDPRNGSFRLLANFYEDRYRKTADGWRISYSRSEPRAIVDGAFALEGVKANWVAAG